MTGRFDHEPAEIKSAVENMKDSVIPAPKQYDKIVVEMDKQFGGMALDETQYKLKYVMYTRAIRQAVDDELMKFNNCKKHLEDNKVNVISVDLAQCDDGIQRAIKWHGKYKQNRSNMYWVLKPL